MSRRGPITGLLVGAALLAWLTGCAVGPRFERPALPIDERYTPEPIVLPPAGANSPRQRLRAGSAPAAQWWRVFGSPPLDLTLARALRSNPTLGAATASLDAARETLAAARGALFPTVDASFGASRSGARSGNPVGAFTGNVYHLGAALAFPLDAFGGTRRRIEQQAALTDYQDEQVAAAYLTLTGNVVAGAVGIAAAQTQIDAVYDILKVDAQNLRLILTAAAAGKASGTDVLAAEGQLANDRTLLPPLRQGLDTSRHALAILVGRSPADWRAPEFRFETLRLPSDLPLTLPSALVRRRPDILAAEAQLHAATAAIGIATANLYPSLGISADWNLEAARTADLFAAAAGAWSAAAGLSAPVFHGGALRAERRSAIAACRASLDAYRETVLRAFGQVADALNALQHDAEALAAEESALEVSRASLELTQQSFQAGQSNVFDLLNAERLYQQARLGHARAVSARYQDTVQLYLVLGGDAPQRTLPAGRGGPR
ncbi:MAG: efflux transporter outer membrane subunit [Gammaproteobacteria bacterium]|nr:efflux transporter outer membrane subunit [Gammaproteobacteria bacterium]